MRFQDDVRQDIKTLWGIPLGKMLKVLLPLGIVLSGFILWFPFPDILWRMGLAIAVFLIVAGIMALNLPRYWGIFKRYRKRPKRLTDNPGPENSGQGVSCLQDLIPADRLHFIEDNVLVEWNNGWVSALCSVQAQPLDYESADTVAQVQKGLKDALTVASSSHLCLRWIDDADFEFDEAVWQERRAQALQGILPGGRALTLDRLETYEAFAKVGALTNRLFLRIDANLSQLMREESGGTDLERKTLALASFSHRVRSYLDVMQRAQLTLCPVGEEDLLWLIRRDVAPWTRGTWATFPEYEESETEGIDSEEDKGTLEILSLEKDMKELQTSSEIEMTPDPSRDGLVPDPPVIQDKPKQGGQTSHPGAHVPPSLLLTNPFKKVQDKAWNPFAGNVQPEPRTTGKTKQKVIPLIKPIVFPDHVVVVLGTKRYAGVTTVAVNLTPANGLLVNLGRGEQPPQWPDRFRVVPVSGEQRVTEIVKLAEGSALVVVDLGLYSSDCSDILKVARTLVYVTDNQPGGLGTSLQQTERLPVDRMILAINKAMPSGLSPGLLSTQLSMPVGIMIPFDHSYGENFGLSLPRKSWDIFQQRIMKQEATAL